jgi:hypothetical protein
MKKLLILILLIIQSLSIFADVIDDGDKQYYGKVRSITGSKIVLRESCTGADIEFQWRAIRLLRFSSECNHPGWNISTSPVEAEIDCTRTRVFVFFIVGSQDVSYAEQFTVTDGTLRIVYAKGKGIKEFSAANLNNVIDWVSLRSICISDIPDDFKTL